MAVPLRFDDEVVVVTGAGGGIGREFALEFARRGARVVVNDLGGSPTGLGDSTSIAMAEAVAEEIRAAGGQAVANGDTVATPEGAVGIVRTAMDSWGRLDALVANAAILRDANFHSMSVSDFDDVIAVNLRGVFCVAQAAYQVMMGNGGGRIVAVTSGSGICGGYGQANYSASKGGVMSLIRSIAWEGRQYGITANALAPGAFDTRQVEAFLETGALLEGRPANPDSSHGPELAFITAARVCPMVVALAHRSCPVTAQTYGAIGGWFHRYWMAHSDGWAGSVHPTAEEVTEHWREIAGTGLPGTEIDDEVMVFATRTNAEKLAPLLAMLAS
jgi:NAD(P)-dependent dehydrogenase (short-subunit alcohol dehydrogenase family)